jgi:hypothetical protein
VDRVVWMVLFWQDRIWFTCLDDRATVERATEIIRKVMENSVSLSVPLAVDFD